MAEQKNKPANTPNTNANDLAKPHATQNRSTHTELNQPATDDVERDEELLDEAADALNDMQSRERRRDSNQRSAFHGVRQRCEQLAHDVYCVVAGRAGFGLKLNPFAFHVARISSRLKNPWCRNSSLPAAS